MGVKKMKLRKVISGGQTGADRTGLECAKRLGLETGGTAPKNYRAEGGVDLTLKDFGLVEDASWTYPPRTEKNVKDSDVTLWFGKSNSPGGRCTVDFCTKHKKRFVDNPDAEEMRMIAASYEVVNVAGNRKSTNPGVVALVEAAFKVLEP